MKPNRRGRRKYRCEECKEESFHHWIERNRAARMRCPACGSARLELCSPEARQDQASLNRVRLAGHPDMSPPPGKPNRKVT
jgi:DNA-directed RNA polymerase subunit RPC12/RpoP